jgi:hypothetical protein
MSQDSMPSLPSMPDGFRIAHCPGRDGYAASSNGDAWTCRTSGKGRGYKSYWRKLSQKTRGDGHKEINTSIDGATCSVAVHRLVLEAFVGPCPPGMEACHFPDRDPGNNRLSNLRWDTHLANISDRAIHGTDNAGSRHGLAKLDELQAAQIKQRYVPKCPVNGGVALSKEFNIARSTITNISKGKAWKHVE